MQTFREFELQGWQKVANRYHDTFAGVTIQCIDALLDLAAVATGSRTLDIACGPGYAAGRVAARGADACGVDFSAEMVAEAQRRYPAAKFQEGDAENLSFSDNEFDAVTMNFGMLHLARPDRATAEAFRVLKAGGRFAFSVWQAPEKTIAFGVVLSSIQKHGDMNVQIPAGPPFFRFSDPNESTAMMKAAGFRDIRHQTVAQTWTLPSVETLFDIMMNASVRNAAMLHAQKPEVLGAIREEMREASRHYLTGGVVQFPMPAILCAGTRP